MNGHSIVIPQAAQVERVLEYAVLTALGHLEVRDRRFVGREARDHRVSAQALGLLDSDGAPSELIIGYCEDPIEFLRGCFEASPVGQEWSRWAWKPLWSVDPTTAEAFLAAATSLDVATRRRRAQTLCAWWTALRPEPDAGEVVQTSEAEQEAEREAEREALLDQPIYCLPLTPQPLSVFAREGITTVREFVTLGREGLLALDLVGYTTVNVLDAILREQPPYEGLDALHASTLVKRERARGPAAAEAPRSIRRVQGFDPEECADLVALWEAVIGTLDEGEQRILRLRTGCLGPVKSLIEIGEEYGRTHSRIWRIEDGAIQRLRRRPDWQAVIDARLRASLGEAGYLPLSQLVADPYFGRLAEGPERPALLHYLTARFLAPTWVTYRWTNDELIVRGARKPEPLKLLAELRREASAGTWPAPWAALEELVAAGLARAGAADLYDLVLEQLGREAVVVGEGPARQVIGFGTKRETQIYLHLAQSPEPVAVAEIVRRFGHGPIPPDCVYARRGSVTLASHFEGFEGWQERVVSEVKRIMAREAPDFQWRAVNLFVAVKERHSLPPWLTHWVLASMLRHSGAVDDLGHQRFALPGTGRGEPITLEATLIELLTDAGRPLAEEALTRKLSILPRKMRLLRTKLPLFPLGDGRVGLVDRDLPGGPKALRAAAKMLEAELRRRGRGLSLHQAALLIRELSRSHREWTEAMVAVVPRVSATLTCKLRAIGLKSWESTRMPTRSELLQSLLDDNQGAVSVAQVQAEVTKCFGKPMTRGSLLSVASVSGIRVKGDWLLSRERDRPPAAERVPGAPRSVGSHRERGSSGSS